MTRALITGIKGFAGSHLAERLISEGGYVCGLDTALDRAPNLEGFRTRLELRECDIRDEAAVRDAIREAAPDEVYHLAAIAHVPTAYRDVRRTFDVNLYGTLNLLDAVKEGAPNARVLFVGSASEYGAVKETEIPIHEDVPLRPVDPYGVSKASADMLACQVGRLDRTAIVRVRSFNHIGPRQSADYVVASLARQIVRIEKGLSEPTIEIGNLEARRDLTDVRDMVSAYVVALREGEPGQVYNICSQRAVRVCDILDRLLAMANVEARIVEDPERMRPSDIPLLLGTCGRLASHTGWWPRIPFDETLRDTLDDWRFRIEAEVSERSGV